MTRTQTPVLPHTAQRILAGAQRSEGGCLLSPLAPSKPRPLVWIPGDRQVMASRVVKAAAIGRPIGADEDVHHECETRRCVDPGHLAVRPMAEHNAHHAAQQRQDRCRRHDRPYDRRNRQGVGICVLCRREYEAGYRHRHPIQLWPEERRRRLNEQQRAYAATPEAKAKARARRATPEAQAKERARNEARRADPQFLERERARGGRRRAAKRAARTAA